jgi:DNA-directed RNA polymerase alpha subunit
VTAEIVSILCEIRDLLRERSQDAQKDIPIELLGLSVRTTNLIEVEGIRTIGELCSRTESELLDVRNFGKTALREIQRKLDEIGLRLGMHDSECRMSKEVFWRLRFQDAERKIADLRRLLHKESLRTRGIS